MEAAFKIHLHSSTWKGSNPSSIEHSSLSRRLPFKIFFIECEERGSTNRQVFILHFLSEKNTIKSSRIGYGRNINSRSLQIFKVRRKAFCISFAGFALFCFAASSFGLVIIFTCFCPDCNSAIRSSVVDTYWGVTVLSFLLGVATLTLLVHYKRRQNSTTSRVAISSNPAEDLEKSPAATLPYNRVSQRWRLPQASSTYQTSLDLPDYFTVIQNTDELYRSANTEVWAEDSLETPPPCYEEAIGRTALALLTAAADVVERYSSEQYASTQDTMDKYNEIFV